MDAFLDPFVSAYKRIMKVLLDIKEDYVMRLKKGSMCILGWDCLPTPISTVRNARLIQFDFQQTYSHPRGDQSASNIECYNLKPLRLFNPGVGGKYVLFK